MASETNNVKKYTCDNCHYFFYLNDAQDDYPTRCPYCGCEIVAFEMEDFHLALV